jgi:hypothetical protein
LKIVVAAGGQCRYKIRDAGGLGDLSIFHVWKALPPRLVDAASGLTACDDEAGTRQPASLVVIGFHAGS